MPNHRLALPGPGAYELLEDISKKGKITLKAKLRNRDSSLHMPAPNAY